MNLADKSIFRLLPEHHIVIVFVVIIFLGGNKMNRTKGLVLFTAIISISYLVFGASQSQSPAYHLFADDNPLFNIEKFFNVASNLVYLIAGLSGLYYLHDNWGNKHIFVEANEAIPFYVLFLGAVFLAFGSGLYHLNPENITLSLDRLTMTIGFMGALSFIICERISLKWGLRLLPILLVVGIGSVAYWIAPELTGQTGDLKPYYLVQGLSLLLILVITLLYPAKYTEAKYIFIALGLYVLAKVFEGFDQQLYDALGIGLSGHTLKHIASGVGVYYLLKYLQKRKPL